MLAHDETQRFLVTATQLLTDQLNLLVEREDHSVLVWLHEGARGRSESGCNANFEGLLLLVYLLVNFYAFGGEGSCLSPRCILAREAVELLKEFLPVFSHSLGGSACGFSLRKWHVDLVLFC